MRPLRILLPIAAATLVTLACLREELPLHSQAGQAPETGAAAGSEHMGHQAHAAPAAEARPSVAILLFDGVQIIDYTGPYEVFGQAGFQVFTVSAAPGAITTSMGMKVVPAYTLAQAPPADVLVLPGGDVDAQLENPTVLAWVRERAPGARHVLSVCNGAFILAQAGLLDGLQATTFYDLIPELRRSYPKVRVVSDQRYVDNGKVITTAGLSSGIDGSLHVVERIRGRGAAQQVALNMEYEWDPDSRYARASLADRHLRRLFGRGLRLGLADGESRVLLTAGGADRWETRWEVKSRTALPVLRAEVARHLRDGGWTPQGPEPAREWRFADEERRPWTARVELAPAPQAAGTYQMAVLLERVGA